MYTIYIKLERVVETVCFLVKLQNVRFIVQFVERKESTKSN